ncbi:hypothetical protein RLEG12_25390 [Rhizobium leguminosarum bv. trifolii CB782]|nr:hypothetical protein RLEG12_25390 [Rhizobium leguminosarum bv. trifolii CB782]
MGNRRKTKKMIAFERVSARIDPISLPFCYELAQTRQNS